MKKIAIIGVTGSVGRSALEVALANPTRFEIVLITAHTNEAALEEIIAKMPYKPKYAFLTSKPNVNAKIIARINEGGVELVLFASSGVSCMSLVYDIIHNGTDIALANKESVVTAGDILMKEAHDKGAMILPVDSEHSAIFQCLLGQDKKHLEKITLTASGGPFRLRPKETFSEITVSEALKHPNWSMGAKITIDSATMINKGLELIEAHFLFDIPYHQLDAIIHPESIIHSYINFTDGASIAQLGYPSMKMPISFALGYPERINSLVEPVDFAKLGKLTFEPIDTEKFRCFKLALQVLASGSNARMTILNVANEYAVHAFIEEKLRFDQIADVIDRALDRSKLKDAVTIEETLENVKKAEELVLHILKKYKVKIR